MGSRGVELCERCGEPDYPWSGCGCESATEREERLLRVEVERVPPPEKVTARQWEAWCNAHGMRTLGPTGRRAWIDTLSTYLRDAEYLVYHEGELIDICNTDSLMPALPMSGPWRVPDTVQHILTVTAELYSCSVGQITGPSRSKPLVAARHIAMYLIRNSTDLSYPKIGRVFSDRDHSTVIHAVRKVEQDMTENKDTCDTIEKLQQLVGG